LGVDEFALRRGHQYGTVLIDMADGHQPLDVFLGREAGDFADWLPLHPGVQVADRWHGWDNLCRHVARLVAAHHTCLPEPTAPATGDPGRGRSTSPGCTAAVAGCGASREHPEAVPTDR